MSFPNLTLFRHYAESVPSAIPKTVLKTHTDNSVTVADAYPKSLFHFIVLPRALPPLDISNLKDLRTLLKCDREQALQVLKRLDADAEAVRAIIEAEMVSKYGFKWEIWTGFHPLPSMEHLHLHVLSADLCTPAMKIKKHYNSFHPKLGFFLHLEEVLSWFEATPSFYDMKRALTPRQYEDRLKEDLMCFKCDDVFKTMPKLKEHLQQEWDRMAKREKAKLAKKRKREEEAAAKAGDGDDGNVKAKKCETESPAE
ncbi:HIT-like domain-containing protein [Sparassis latifolia]|uniref:HIT-like protein n=1 Tax=Sparassis crispa TaxID=139825 RepID=A0A401GIJ1_9APHY|nr:HIT-like protein [Sparassis crispa]GBE81931.1 HIT-like protein [Sparassis crispa]